MRVRPATSEDAGAIAAVKIAAWRHAYEELVGGQVLELLDHDDEAGEWRTRLVEPWATLVHVVEQDGRVIAVAAWLMPRTTVSEPVRSAQLAHLYVHPVAQGAGVGSELLARAEDALRAVGGRTAQLSLHRDNHWAGRFLAARGWVLDAEAPIDAEPMRRWTRDLSLVGTGPDGGDPEGR